MTVSGRKKPQPDHYTVHLHCKCTIGTMYVKFCNIMKSKIFNSWNMFMSVKLPKGSQKEREKEIGTNKANTKLVLVIRIIDIIT